MAKKNTYRISDETKAAVLADLASGVTNDDVAKKHGIGRSTISRIVTVARGERAAVTRAMLLEAKSMGLTRSQAARHFNVAPQDFSYACRKHGIELVRSKNDPYRGGERLAARADAMEMEQDDLHPQEVIASDRKPAVATHPIAATKGEWKALAEYAASHGITTTKAQQLWHKARMGVLA